MSCGQCLMVSPFVTVHHAHLLALTLSRDSSYRVCSGEVWAPTTKYQLAGITRQHVIDIATAAGVVVRECDFALTKVYSAEEVCSQPPPPRYRFCLAHGLHRLWLSQTTLIIKRL